MVASKEEGEVGCVARCMLLLSQLTTHLSSVEGVDDSRVLVLEMAEAHGASVDQYENCRLPKLENLLSQLNL